MTFVDLAGREDQAASQNKEMQFREMTYINTSLYHLSHLITKLSEGTLQKGSLADFRNSKLTLLLSQALAGLNSGKNVSMNNVFMQLRKLCNHPQLLSKEDVPMPSLAHAKAVADTVAKLVQGSGKMTLLHKLLPQLRSEDRKVLLFSQVQP